jgi:hypothetical protein
MWGLPDSGAMKNLNFILLHYEMPRCARARYDFDYGMSLLRSSGLLADEQGRNRARDLSITAWNEYKRENAQAAWGYAMRKLSR